MDEYDGREDDIMNKQESRSDYSAILKIRNTTKGMEVCIESIWPFSSYWPLPC